MAIRRGRARSGLLIVGNLLALAFILGPLAAVVLGAVQTEKDLLANAGHILPRNVSGANFAALVGSPGAGDLYVPPSLRAFPRTFINSTVVALVTTGLTVGFGALSAYSIARLRFRGSRVYSLTILVTRLVPIVVLVIPLYLALRQLHLLDTLLGVVVAEVGFLLPYATWILVSHFAALPAELEDAARTDGATRFGAFARIMLPLAAPGLASAGVIIFMMSWNEFIIPLVITTSPNSLTLPVLASSFVTEVLVSYTLLMAISLVALTPTVVLAVLLHRYVVRGLIVGAVKG